MHLALNWGHLKISNRVVGWLHRITRTYKDLIWVEQFRKARSSPNIGINLHQVDFVLNQEPLPCTTHIPVPTWLSWISSIHLTHLGLAQFPPLTTLLTLYSTITGFPCSYMNLPAATKVPVSRALSFSSPVSKRISMTRIAARQTNKRSTAQKQIIG